MESAQYLQHFRNSSKYFSEFCWQIFGRVVKIGFYMYIAAFWRNIFTLQRIHIFFSSFSGSDRKICRFLEKNFCDRCQNCILRCWRIIFDEKMNFVQKMYIHLFSNLGVCFVFLPTMLRQACQNIIVHVQTNIFTNRFFGKLINFSSFPDFEQKFSEIWREFFGTVVTTAFCVSRSIFFFQFSKEGNEGKNFSKKSHCHQFKALSEKDPQCFCRHGYGRLVKTSLYMFRRRFSQTGFLESLSIFPHFRESSKNCTEFSRENFGRVVTTAFYFHIGPLLGKLFSFRKIHIFFRGFRNLSCKGGDSQ